VTCQRCGQPVAIAMTVETDEGRTCARCPGWALEPIVVVRRADA
jgi:hypothetical protein